MSADTTRRRFIGGLGAVATAGVRRRADAMEDDTAIYLHVWVERLVADPGSPTGYGTKIIHLSDGPFSPEAAEVRIREVGTVGYRIGIHLFPPNRVLLVETRLGR